MELETQLNATLPASVQPHASTYSAVGLWYCQRCTTLILPPGAVGIKSEEGQRYCASCAPFEVKDAPATSLITVVPGRFSDYVPERVGAAASSRFNTNSSTIKGGGSKPAPATQTRWIVGGFVAACLIGGFVLMRPGSSPAKTNTVAQLPAQEPIVKKTVVIGGSDAAVVTEKNTTPTAAKVSLFDERAARMEALAHAGGILSPGPQTNANPNSNNGVPPTDVNPVSAPIASNSVQPPQAAQPVAKEQQLGAAPSAEAIDNQLNAIAGLLRSEKYSDAEAVLAKLSKDRANADKESPQQKRVIEVRDTLAAQKQAFEQRGRDAIALAQGAKTADRLADLDAAWKRKMDAGGSTAQTAKQVLDAVCDARKRIKAELDARSDAFEKSLNLYAKRPPAKTGKADADTAAGLKFVADARTQLLDDRELFARYADRLGELYLDLTANRSSDRAVFGVEPVSRGSAISILAYDFSTPEQSKAWKFEGGGAGAEKNSMIVDERQKSLVIKVSGEHPFDPDKGRRAPIATLPFLFDNASWSFEADSVETQTTAKKNVRPFFGIQVSDGGKNVIQVFARELKKTEWGFGIRAADGKEPHNTTLGKLDEPLVIHFKMTCENGKIELSAGPRDKQPIKVSVPLKFEPTSAGLFVETHDADENVSVNFFNVSTRGVLNTSKVGEIFKRQRAEEIKTFKAHLLKPAVPASVPPKK